MASQTSEKREWNTKNLNRRVAADAMSAAAAGGIIAPVVSMIDKSIIENASGRRELLTSIKASLKQLVTRPHRYVTSKPFALIFMVYGGTYLAANLTDTAKSTTTAKPASHVTSGWSKFLATNTGNLSLTMIKDTQFTKMFGTVSARPIPPVTYALFAVRDSMTIFSSFNLPPLIAPLLPVSQEMERYVSRATAAQFLAPAGMQLLSTPFHLYGLDLYNRQKASIFNRLSQVGVNWAKSSVARICRILPAFGVGGVVNSNVRRKLMTELE